MAARTKRQPCPHCKVDGIVFPTKTRSVTIRDKFGAKQSVYGYACRPCVGKYHRSGKFENMGWVG